MSRVPADQRIAQGLALAVGAPVTILTSERLGGGCISDTRRLHTSTGPFVVKSRHDAPSGFFQAEAAGLRALAASATSLRVPRVIACEDDGEDFQWIVLEDLDAPDAAAAPRPLPPSRAVDEAIGHGLALLHRSSGPAFGFTCETYCGSTRQPNPWTDRWVDFYASARLGHQLALARDDGRLEATDARRISDLIGRLDRWLDEPASGSALVHGDLWSGNLHIDPAGRPALVDPSASYAHRESELGIMTLFGGFGPRVFSAYEESWPLESGWRDRLPLYQLYHLLNHLNLFGAGYHAPSMAIVRRFA